MDIKVEQNLSQKFSDKWSMGSPVITLEPFFASLAAMNPHTNLDTTDIIAHAKTLSLMLGFACDKPGHFGLNNRAAAFHVALVNNTLVIERLSKDYRADFTSDLGQLSRQETFAKRIAQMQASEDNMSSVHYHALRYAIGPLNCVAIVRINAALGNTSLPPFNFDQNSLGIPTAQGFTTVRRGGRGVPTGAVVSITTRTMPPMESGSRRINGRGHLKLQPRWVAQAWCKRPAHIVLGHVEPAPPHDPEHVFRLSRIGLRPAEPVLATIDNMWQLELRKLVVLLRRLRDTAKSAGGSCVLTCMPAQKASGDKPAVPRKYELFTCSPAIEPLVLDWHAKRFWSKR